MHTCTHAHTLSPKVPVCAEQGPEDLQEADGQAGVRVADHQVRKQHNAAWLRKGEQFLGGGKKPTIHKTCSVTKQQKKRSTCENTTSHALLPNPQAQ